MDDDSDNYNSIKPIGYTISSTFVQNGIGGTVQGNNKGA